MKKKRRRRKQKHRYYYSWIPIEEGKQRSVRMIQIPPNEVKTVSAHRFDPQKNVIVVCVIASKEFNPADHPGETLSVNEFDDWSNKIFRKLRHSSNKRGKRARKKVIRVIYTSDLRADYVNSSSSGWQLDPNITGGIKGAGVTTILVIGLWRLYDYLSGGESQT